MKLEVNGKKYYGFTEATADVRLDALSNSFSFEAAPANDIKIPFILGDECVVYVDDLPVITGHVEVITGSGSYETSKISIIGRDKTADIVDSKIGVLNDVKAPITFKRVVELVIQHIGAEIDVIDLAGVSLDRADDIVAAEPGDGAFDFLEKIARKKNVILTSNSDGNVVIQKAIGQLIEASVIHRTDGQGNNAISYAFKYDDTQRFHRYEAVGNLNVNSLSTFGAIAPKKVVSQSGFVLDERIREGRQYIISSEQFGSSGNMKDRSSWEANIRRARSRVYTAVVTGYKNQTGDIWTPNTLVKVSDDRANIDDVMLINAVTYRLTSDEGSTTELSLVNRDAYTLEFSEPEDAKKAKKKNTFDPTKYQND